MVKFRFYVKKKFKKDKKKDYYTTFLQ